MILNVSLKRSNALGRESTTQADAITMNKPSNPRICQQGRAEDRTCSKEFRYWCYQDRCRIGGICVAMDVAEGVSGFVAVGIAVIIAVEVAIVGLRLFPHRDRTNHECHKRPPQRYIRQKALKFHP